MKGRATIPATLLSLETIALGRFVTNKKSPAEEFYESNLLTNAAGDKVIVTARNNFREVLRSTFGTTTYSNLTAIISSYFNISNQEYVLLEGISNKTYQLENSTEVFEHICSDPGARKWLLKMLGRRRSIYMVVGFETITNAEVSCGNLKAKERGGEITAPVSVAMAGAMAVPIPFTDVLDVGGGMSRVEEQEVRTSFLAPGEMIYAVQYRKVEFSWFSSRDIDKATLQNSRWVINIGVRCVQKVEEPDVVDAHLVSEPAGGEEAGESEGASDSLLVEPLGIRFSD